MMKLDHRGVRLFQQVRVIIDEVELGSLDVAFQKIDTIECVDDVAEIDIRHKLRTPCLLGRSAVTVMYVTLRDVGTAFPFADQPVNQRYAVAEKGFVDDPA